LQILIKESSTNLIQELIARDVEKPRSLRGTLLRKLSVKHQAELESENLNGKKNRAVVVGFRL